MIVIVYLLIIYYSLFKILIKGGFSNNQNNNYINVVERDHHMPKRINPSLLTDSRRPPLSDENRLCLGYFIQYCICHVRPRKCVRADTIKL
jgi:hypothetical protein